MMKGYVYDYDAQRQCGTIIGDDQVSYPFYLEYWCEQELPCPGDVVTFAVSVQDTAQYIRYENHYRNKKKEIRLAEAGEHQKKYALLAYVCYLLGLFSAGIFTLIGLIMAYVKYDKFGPTIYARHLKELMRIFWLAVFWAIGGVILLIIVFIAYMISLEILVAWIVPVVIFVWAVVVLWYFCRLLYGVARLIKDQPPR